MEDVNHMKIALISIPLFCGVAACTPEFYKAAEDIATDGVIQIQMDKEAFDKNTDVEINVRVKNKDPA